MQREKIKFVISGYYGHDNFGDEAILSCIVSDINENYDNPEITVISNNPIVTGYRHRVKSIHKFNFLKIFNSISGSDVLISGGGSLLQDVTSKKSLVYYLFLIFLAKLLGKKTFIFAQGIGPLNSNFSKKLTSLTLKNVDIITVRDINSSEILKSLNINSMVTSDPVWTIKNTEFKKTNSQKIGVQLRKWDMLDEPKIMALAEAIIQNFREAEIILLPLHAEIDISILETFLGILREKGANNKTRFVEPKYDEITKEIASLDCLIAMRYHACLIAAKFNVPFIALSYDPKVEQLANNCSVPTINVESMSFNILDEKIKMIISEKSSIIKRLKDKSIQNQNIAENNIKVLKKII